MKQVLGSYAGLLATFTFVIFLLIAPLDLFLKYWKIIITFTLFIEILAYQIESFLKRGQFLVLYSNWARLFVLLLVWIT
jgi:hypothetical protein